MPGTILATGGSGYIGSHVVAELLATGRRVVILDDLSNSTAAVAERIAVLGHGVPELIVGDVGDAAVLDRLFGAFDIAAVIHLAGLKAVGESVAQPLRYMRVNVGGTLALLQAMQRHRVRRLVFSSSATVYGAAAPSPIPETAPLGAANPYGRSKLVIEGLLDDLAAAEPGFAAVSLRYFNPVGAHASATLGESPLGVPNNLFPFIAQTAAGLRGAVRVFGTDYPTPDGTGVRDYIHVVDLAQGHVAALDLLLGDHTAGGGHIPINLGCGRGYSVLEALAAFERAVGRPLPREIVARRPGDVAESVADPSRAADLLGWRATRDLDAMCADHWAFQRRELER